MLKIQNGDLDKLTLGNIYTERDWGFAGDYVECMWKMLQIFTPTDFIIATGKSYSVKEFLTETAKICGIKNWRDVVKFDNSLIRQIDYKQKIGDSSKAKKILKWKSKTTFEDLVHLMIKNKPF
jgi:GDPmannose 4,6-dehydratase